MNFCSINSESHEYPRGISHQKFKPVKTVCASKIHRNVVKILWWSRICRKARSFGKFCKQVSALLLNNTVVFLLNRMHEIFFSLLLKFLKMVQWFLAASWNFFCMHIITLVDQGSVVFICWNACTHSCWFKFA